MQMKEFHLGDVLSITTGYLVSPRHIDGVYDILSFMTGESIFTHQLPRVGNECKPYLVAQFPQLTTAEMDSAIAELVEALEDKSREKEVRKKIVVDWLARQVAKYGEMFAVKPIPADAHEVKDPIVEAAEMMGDPKRVVVGIIE